MEDDAAYAALDALAETDDAGAQARELEAREAALKAEIAQLRPRVDKSEALVRKLDARRAVLLSNTDKLYEASKQLVDEADAKLHELRSAVTAAGRVPRR